MSGNAQNEIDEVGQMLDLIMAVQRAMAPVARKMTKQARQSWIGLPTLELTRVLERLVFLPSVEIPNLGQKVGDIKSDLFFVSATTQLDAVPAKPQNECFVGEDWSYRDRDFDNWFTKDQPGADSCIVTTISFKKNWTFTKFAVAILGDEWQGKSIKSLGEEIIRRKLTLTNAQAEAMAKLTEQGTATGMHTEGYGNFYFTETGDAKNPVATARVSRAFRSWDAHVYRLGHGYDWHAHNWFLLRNLEDTSTL